MDKELTNITNKYFNCASNQHVAYILLWTF